MVNLWLKSHINHQQVKLNIISQFLPNDKNKLSSLFRQIAIGFTFCKKPFMSIINSITCKIYPKTYRAFIKELTKYLINQVSIKVKMSSLYEGGCINKHCIYLVLEKESSNHG